MMIDTKPSTMSIRDLRVETGDDNPEENGERS